MYDILLIVLAVLATAGRVLGLIGLSILSGWVLSYMAIKNRIFENIFISVNEVFESVPVIAFFPIVLVIFIAHIGGALGVELASDFLVFTAVVWNLWLGEYQAFKTVPKEMVEIADNYNYSLFERLKAVYIPFSIPRIAANLFPSVSDGFFYITVSEVFTVGITTYETFGVGYTLGNYVKEGNFFLVSVTLIVMGIVVTGIILALKEITKRAVSKYALDTDVPIMRRGKPRLRQSATLSAITSLNPLGKLATYNRMSRRKTSKLRYFILCKKQEEKLRINWCNSRYCNIITSNICCLRNNYFNINRRVGTSYRQNSHIASKLALRLYPSSNNYSNLNCICNFRWLSHSDA